MPRRKPVATAAEGGVSAPAEVINLSEQIVRLWQALDTVRAELHAVLDARPERQSLSSPYRLTSMALDPCDPNWNEKLNAFTSEDLPEELRPAPPASAQQANTATAAQEASEQIFYCCAEPQLAWAGDPDEPSVLCLKCGYVVAEYGTVIDEREAWREGTASFEVGPPPREIQSELFGTDE